MPRTTRGGGGGARRGHHTPFRGPGRGNQNLQTTFVPFAGAYIPQVAHGGFTLQDEARNTERHQSNDNFDQGLRYAKVNFVSAGSLEPPDPIKDSEDALAAMSLEPAELTGSKLPKEAQIDDGLSTNALRAQPEENEELTMASHFVVDTLGGKPIETGLPLPRLRSISPAPSDSSEEVILFHGREQSAIRPIKIQADPISETKTESPVETDSIEEKIKMVEDRLLEQQKLLHETLREKELLSDSYTPEVRRSPSPNFEAILPKRATSRSRGRARGRRPTNEDEEDAMIADYIANMDEDPADITFNRRELGGGLGDDEGEDWQDANDADQAIGEASGHGWGRSELQDLDELSTSDEARGKVQTVLSKRERATGITQYLVVWENDHVDEARWVSTNILHDSGALPLIEVFEAEEKLVAQFDSNDEEDTDDSDEIDDDDGDDEQDLVQRRIDRMDDEQIARILAKQEELGMGGDEILLFDDAADDDEDMPARPVDLNRFVLSGRQTQKGKQRSQREFPPAAALADAYDGFDVMDFDRPALKKKPKGRKGRLILDDVSDPELEASMQSAWENDRSKKKERKQEREILRAQGLLTGKHGKPDLKAKYKEGMDIHAVKDEIKQFLMSGDSTLALPPMDKADRKVVHEIAIAFKLKSKSAGSGAKRFPILFRTSRTSRYVERTFDEIEAKLRRRYLPRNDVGGRRAGAVPRTSGRGGGGFNAAVSYRDGDIVGGSAPELGVENKGRAMLEKMGWSSGTALGALNNKGILQPVTHVVKTTKAGLG